MCKHKCGYHSTQLFKTTSSAATRLAAKESLPSLFTHWPLSPNFHCRGKRLNLRVRSPMANLPWCMSCRHRRRYGCARQTSSAVWPEKNGSGGGKRSTIRSTVATGSTRPRAKCTVPSSLQASTCQCQAAALCCFCARRAARTARRKIKSSRPKASKLSRESMRCSTPLVTPRFCGPARVRAAAATRNAGEVSLRVRGLLKGTWGTVPVYYELQLDPMRLLNTNWMQSKYAATTCAVEALQVHRLNLWLKRSG